MIVQALFLLMLLSPNSLNAQTGVQRFNGYNAKHYAIDAFSGNVNQYLMAGTLFNYSAGGPTTDAVHWIQTSSTLANSFSKVIDDDTYNEYPVSDHADGATGDKIIVAGMRSTTGARDGVEILRINAAGTLQATSRKITSANATYRQLYPMGSLLYDNTTLLICGYLAATGNPTPTTAKVGFVFGYDLAANQVIPNSMVFYATSSPSGFAKNF